MAKKPKDHATEYMEGILARIPEDKREAVKAALFQDEILTDLGEHIMLRSDYSRGQDELKASGEKLDQYKGQLDQWYVDNQNLLAEGGKAIDKLKAAEGKGKGGDDDSDEGKPPILPNLDAYLKRDEATQILASALMRRDQEGMAYFHLLNRLSLRHFKEFGEIIDADALTAHALKNKLALEPAYQDLMKDRFSEKQKKEHDDWIAAEREKIRTEERDKLMHSSGFTPGAPYPPPGDEPSTLAGLVSADGKKTKDYGVEAALNDYYRQGQRTGT